MIKSIFFVAIISLFFFTSEGLLCKKLSEPVLVYKSNNVWTAVDEAGKTLFTSDILLDVEAYSEGLLSGYAYHKDKIVSVYYNNLGKIELASNSAKAHPFMENFALITEEKKLGDKRYEYRYGITNKQGEIVVPVEQFDAGPFTEGLAYIMNQEERGFIDTSGKLVIKLGKGESGYGFSEGLSPVSRIDIARFGFIDKTGKLVVEHKYHEVGKFSEGLAKVSYINLDYHADFFGYINTAGDLVIENIYTEATSFQNGLAFVGVLIEGQLRWGVINKDGVNVSDYLFLEHKSFSDSVAVVKNINDSLFYYIDYQANPINANKYKYCGSFKNDKAFVVLPNDKKCFIDKKDNCLFEIPQDAEIVLDCRTNEKYSAKQDKDSEPN